VAGQADGPTPLGDRSRADALRETVELASELVDALVTQARRAQRQCEEAAGSGGLADPAAASSLLERLAQRAESLADGMAQIAASVSASATPPAPAEPAGEAPIVPVDADEARDPDRASDPARMLAMEMVTQGRSRDEVEDYLVQTFGLDNAPEIVDDVLSRTRGE
jgi:hypothetical protein